MSQRPSGRRRPPRRQALRLIAVAALAAVAAPTFASSPAASASSGLLTPARDAALAARAYVYGIAPEEFARVRRTDTSVCRPDGAGHAPLNTLSVVPHFATPAEKTVVAPNVDTLYTEGQLDLGRGPVVLHHPNMGHRYFVYELLDPYTNVIGYIGSRTTGEKAGSFAISWQGHPGPKVHGATVIHSRYRRVWVIGRTLAHRGSDRKRAVALMRRTTLSPPGGPRRINRHCQPSRPRAATTPAGLRFLDELSKILAHDPPPARDAPLLAKLKTIGVGPGLTPQTAGLSAADLAAIAKGVNAAKAKLPGLVQLATLAQARTAQGWAIPKPDIGRYGTHYLYRAGIALGGLGANTNAEALYPTGLIDSTGAPLDGSAHSYRMTFAPGQAPPARAFWSLTMYDTQGDLVANPEHRYAVGSDHRPLAHEPDGSIVVDISHTRPADPNVNWLPAPAAPFRLNLRLYWPRRTALNGTWRPPPVVPETATGPAGGGR